MLKIDEKKLVSLLKDFNKLTGIKICLFDENGTEVACVPKTYCEFCQYIRSSVLGAKNCTESDLRGFEMCRNTGKPYRYVCHMGLTECVMPILQQGNCIGYIMIGQTAGERLHSADFTKKAAEYDLDPEKINKLYGLIEFAEEEKVSASISIMEACAGYLYLNKLVHHTESVAGKIDNFITEHLSEELSVNRLCSEFKLSRVNLYSCIHQSFNTTPAEYIKKRRLTEACRLLKESNMRITEIAEAVGISDYNYFSKIFKKDIGMSPREYRRQV